MFCLVLGRYSRASYACTDIVIVSFLGAIPVCDILFFGVNAHFIDVKIGLVTINGDYLGQDTRSMKSSHHPITIYIMCQLHDVCFRGIACSITEMDHEIKASKTFSM